MMLHAVSRRFVVGQRNIGCLVNISSAPIERWKDVVIVMLGERVRVLMRFTDYTGLYLYHCHILEHEDSGMMRKLPGSGMTNQGVMFSRLLGLEQQSLAGIGGQGVCRSEAGSPNVS